MKILITHIYHKWQADLCGTAINAPFSGLLQSAWQIALKVTSAATSAERLNVCVCVCVCVPTHTVFVSFSKAVAFRQNFAAE